MKGVQVTFGVQGAITPSDIYKEIHFSSVGFDTFYAITTITTLHEELDLTDQNYNATRYTTTSSAVQLLNSFVVNPDNSTDGTKHFTIFGLFLFFSRFFPDVFFHRLSWSFVRFWNPKFRNRPLRLHLHNREFTRRFRRNDRIVDGPRHNQNHGCHSLDVGFIQDEVVRSSGRPL